MHSKRGRHGGERSYSCRSSGCADADASSSSFPCSHAQFRRLTLRMSSATRGERGVQADGRDTSHFAPRARDIRGIHSLLGWPRILSFIEQNDALSCRDAVVPHVRRDPLRVQLSLRCLCKLAPATQRCSCCEVKRLNVIIALVRSSGAASAENRGDIRNYSQTTDAHRRSLAKS